MKSAYKTVIVMYWGSNSARRNHRAAYRRTKKVARRIDAKNAAE